jgi:hypothetical protein
MGFFDDLPVLEPRPPRRQHPWDPPDAEFPGNVPIDTLLLGRTEQVAVGVTGLSAFSGGIVISLTARIRPSADHPEEHLPGGPRDLAASRRSFRFGLQFSDGGRAAGSLGGTRPDRVSQPAGPVLYAFVGGGRPYSFISRWWTWATRAGSSTGCWAASVSIPPARMRRLLCWVACRYQSEPRPPADLM